MIGEVFGSFRITVRLAGGGMGVVYRAVHVTSGEKAAVKHLLPQFAGDPEMIARFLQEARMAAAIDDPGIVRVYDAGEVATGGAYLVMELLAGETLAARVRRDGALPAATAVAILRQVCRTVGVAHSTRIIHRDLKPDNIFCVPDPDIPVGVRAKVLDFGIAKLLSDSPGFHTMTGLAMGTPGYMAPELWTNAKASDERTDIYALGCIAFELLSGGVAFPGPSLAAFLDQHRHEPPPPLPPALAPYQPVIDRALAKAPADRWQTTEAFAAALSAVTDPALAVTRLLPPSASDRGAAKGAPSDANDRNASAGSAEANGGDVRRATSPSDASDRDAPLSGHRESARSSNANVDHNHEPRAPDPARGRRPNIAKMIVLGGAAIGVLAIVSSVAFRKRRATDAPTGPAEVCDRVITVSTQVPTVLPIGYRDRIRDLTAGAIVTFGTHYSDEIEAVEAPTYFDVFHESAAGVNANTLERWSTRHGALVDAQYAGNRALEPGREVLVRDDDGHTHHVAFADSFVARGPTPSVLTRHNGASDDSVSWFATRVWARDAERIARAIDERFSSTRPTTSSFVDPSCTRAAPPLPTTKPKTIRELRNGDTRATVGDDGMIELVTSNFAAVLGIAAEWLVTADGDSSAELRRTAATLDVRERVRLDAHLVVELDVTATGTTPLHHAEIVTLFAPPAGWYASCRRTGDRVVVTYSHSQRGLPCPRRLELPFELQPDQTARQVLELHVRRD